MSMARGGALSLAVLLAGSATFAAGEVSPAPKKSKVVTTAPATSRPITPATSRPIALATSRPTAPAIDWAFNEGRDQVVGDGAGGALNGKAVGGPEWVNGRGTGALRFDGIDDYVEIDAPLPDAEAISIEAWIKLDENAAGINTILCDSDKAAEDDFWLGVESQAVLISACKDEKSLGEARTNGNQAFERVLLDHDIRGKWVHIVWSMDDTQSVVYIDGKPAGMIAKGGSNVGHHCSHPTIGCFSVEAAKPEADKEEAGNAKKSKDAPKRTTSKFFSGTIDSLRVYPGALDDRQVAELFTGPPKSPVIARKRRAVPQAPLLDAATKTVRETFKDDYAAKTPEARKTFGDHLMAAAESETDLATQFVMLREARDSYAGAGEVERALDAAAAMAERFIVSGAETRLEALAIAVKGPNLGDNGKPIAEAALGAANVLASAGKYTAALKGLGLADTAAKGAKDSPLGTIIHDRSRELKDIQAQWFKVESALAALDAKPDDPDANLRVGRFYCLVAGDWERGLPLLAKSSDAKLKALASKDLAAPTDGPGRLTVANGWWDYSPTVPPSSALLVKSRAVTWYELALPDLDETAAGRIRQRVNEAQSGKRVNVLVLADPKSDSMRGKWKLSRGVLASDNSELAQYEFNYRPPVEYDLRVVLTPTAGDNQMAVLFPAGSGALALNIATSSVSFEDPANRAFRGGRHGGSRADAFTHALPRNLTQGQRHTVVIKVRDSGIAAYLDGEQMFKLDADSADIPPSRAWRLNEPKCVGVGANDTEVLVQSVDVLEVRGKGIVGKQPAEEAAK